MNITQHKIFLDGILIVRNKKLSFLQVAYAKTFIVSKMDNLKAPSKQNFLEMAKQNLTSVIAGLLEL